MYTATFWRNIAIAFAVGWVFWPVSRITYMYAVLVETLNPAQSNQSNP